MAHGWMIAVNAGLPGAGLVLHGRPIVGGTFLACALLAVSLAGAALVNVDIGWPFALLAMCGYACLSALASLAWWLDARAAIIDPKAVRALHNEATVAYLRDEHATAILAAQKLVKAAPMEPGAWDMLALIAHAAGEKKIALIAERRAAVLKRRAQAA